MKALSIRAPWWWFILHGGKDIENRDWPTSFRGTIYVHASKSWIHRDILDDMHCIATEILRGKWPCEPPRLGPLEAAGGCLVGKVDIVGCTSHSTSPWFFGKWGFQLANPIAFDEPVPCKGALGIFTVPADALARIGGAVVGQTNLLF